MDADLFTIHADGGARSNPGPAAIGFTVEGPGIARVEHGEYIGETTNNVAEYTAVLKGLAKLKALLGTDKAKRAKVRVFADSELIVRQANGIYKIKDEDLGRLFIKLFNARQDFGSVTFDHIPREQNRDADRMVNEALDRTMAPDLGV